jgi:hypothetical protein
MTQNPAMTQETALAGKLGDLCRLYSAQKHGATLPNRPIRDDAKLQGSASLLRKGNARRLQRISLMVKEAMSMLGAYERRGELRLWTASASTFDSCRFYTPIGGVI